MRAVMQLVTLRRAAAVAVWCSVLARPSSAQQRDTTTPPRDSLKVYTLPPAVVSVTRANPPISKIPLAVHLVEKTDISRARPTWGLDEALATVPGVYAANRYNFSLDQRISIRGFGARSAFAVRGIKVLLDGIPQTLPDGQGQLTNVEPRAADRIEVLRGSVRSAAPSSTLVSWPWPSGSVWGMPSSSTLMPRTANAERAPNPRIEMRWSREKLYRFAAYTPGNVASASSRPHVGRARLMSVFSTRLTANGILLIGGLARVTETTAGGRV